MDLALRFVDISRVVEAIDEKDDIEGRPGRSVGWLSNYLVDYGDHSRGGMNMKIELFKDKSLRDSAMEKFDLLYSKLKKINADSYRDAFVEAVSGEGKNVAYGVYRIDPSFINAQMQAGFLVKGGYACRFEIAFKHPILVIYRFENLLTAAYFLTLFEAAGKAYDKIAAEKPRDFAGHCEAVARQVEMHVRRIENELSKY